MAARGAPRRVMEKTRICAKCVLPENADSKAGLKALVAKNKPSCAMTNARAIEAPDRRVPLTTSSLATPPGLTAIDDTRVRIARRVSATMPMATNGRRARTEIHVTSVQRSLRTGARRSPWRRARALADSP